MMMLLAHPLFCCSVYPSASCLGPCLRELLGGVDDLAGTVEVSVAHAVWVVVAAVGIAAASKAVVGVGSSTVVPLTDVVLVVLTWVRSKGEGVRVGLPVRRQLALEFLCLFRRGDYCTHQTSISAQQAPKGPTPELGSEVDDCHPSMFAFPPTNLRSRAH